MKHLNLLFTSVGRRSYLVNYFKEALNGTGTIHVANSSDHSPAFQVADRSVVTPLIYDEAYIPFLLDYCKENQIDAIISLFDIDLPILAQNKERFKEIGTNVLVSDPGVVERCNDKWQTYQFLVENGFHAPATFLSVEDVKKAISEGKVSYPLIVKPRWGMGSIGVFEVENDEELSVIYKKTQRNIQQTYLKYESEQDTDRCVLIQEKILGQEYGLDVINDFNANYRNTICKMKYAMRSGETDCAITVDSEDLRNLGEHLSKTMGHIGNMDVDVFKTQDTTYILEMNARFGGGYPFSHVAGVNLPLAFIMWLRGEEPDMELLTPTYGITVQKDISLVIL